MIIFIVIIIQLNSTAIKVSSLAGGDCGSGILTVIGLTIITHHDMMLAMIKMMKVVLQLVLKELKG